MKNNTYFLLLLFSTVSLISYSQNKDAHLKQKHPVELLYLSRIDAFNSHNVEKYLIQFADNIEMYTNNDWYRGISSVRKRFTFLFQQFPSIKMEISNFNLREVAKKTVVIDFTWKVLPNGNDPAWLGIGTGVYVLRNDRWVEVLEHETFKEIVVKPNTPEVELIKKYYAYFYTIPTYFE